MGSRSQNSCLAKKLKIQLGGAHTEMTQDAGFSRGKEGLYVIMRLEKDPPEPGFKSAKPGMRPEGVAEMVSTSSIHSIGNNYLEIIKDLRLTG